MIEAIREAVVYLAHTHDGARVAMHCLWHGTPKVSVSQGLTCLSLDFFGLLGVLPSCAQQYHLCKAVPQGLTETGSPLSLLFLPYWSLLKVRKPWVVLYGEACVKQVNTLFMLGLSL